MGNSLCVCVGKSVHHSSTVPVAADGEYVGQMGNLENVIGGM